jgi:glycosyltransferase involved in cell wall biosynthesis
MMRVCVLAYTFYEGDNRVRRYAEALVKRGDVVDVVAIGQPGQPRRVTISGVNVYRVQNRRINENGHFDYFIKILFFLILSFRSLTWRHLRHPYQLIHVHSIPDFEVFAAVVAKWTGAKVILDIHDIVPEFYAAKFHSGTVTYLARLLMWVEKRCCRFADHVIISNPIWAEKLIVRSVTANKCTVMLNYPDPAIFKYPGSRPVNALFTLIYPGSLSKHQGLDIAIRALARVKDVMPAFAFHIYGRGSEETSLKELAITLGLSDHVFFHGVLPLEAIAEKMAQSDLGLIPKRADGFGDEAFSTKSLEFMAMGTPVIMSSTRIDRYYFDDTLVRFFESDNVHDLAFAIVFLANNPNERKAMADKALEFVKPYSWDAKRSDYFKLVDEMTGQREGKNQ